MDGTAQSKRSKVRSQSQGSWRSIQCDGLATGCVPVQVLGEPGRGKVLVVDGGGSLRCALLGDQIAKMALDNGWEVGGSCIIGVTGSCVWGGAGAGARQ